MIEWPNDGPFDIIELQAAKRREIAMSDDSDDANPPEFYEDWYDVWLQEQVKTINEFYGIA